jgi:hypothetical protein
MADPTLSQADIAGRSNFYGALGAYHRRRSDVVSCPAGVESVLLHLVEAEDEAFETLLATPPATLTALAEKFEAVIAYANGACGGDLDVTSAEQLLRDLRKLVAS